MISNELVCYNFEGLSEECLQNCPKAQNRYAVAESGVKRVQSRTPEYSTAREQTCGEFFVETFVELNCPGFDSDSDRCLAIGSGRVKIYHAISEDVE